MHRNLRNPPNTCQPLFLVASSKNPRTLTEKR